MAYILSYTHYFCGQEENDKLKSRAAQLEKQINVLIDDSVVLLKARMTELDINANSPVDLLAKAKEIVMRHKDLQAKAARLQSQVWPFSYPKILVCKFLS